MGLAVDHGDRSRPAFADLPTDELLALLPGADRAKALAILGLLRHREPAPQLLSILDKLDLSLSVALSHARDWARRPDHPLVGPA